MNKTRFSVVLRCEGDRNNLEIMEVLLLGINRTTSYLLVYLVSVQSYQRLHFVECTLIGSVLVVSVDRPGIDWFLCIYLERVWLELVILSDRLTI